MRKLCGLNAARHGGSVVAVVAVCVTFLVTFGVFSDTLMKTGVCFLRLFEEAPE